MTTGPSAPPRLLPVVLPALLAPAAVFAAFALGSASPGLGRAALPILATLAIYPLFARLVIASRRGAATAAALLWAASLSVSLIGHTARFPEAAGGGILRGPAYRDEMFRYVASGEGRETDPRRFVPEHLMHAGIFALVTLASGGLLGLAMGAVLVGYMSYYVGALAAGPQPMTAALLGWPPWAIVRVVAFVLLGTVLARPLLLRLRGRGAEPWFERPDRRILLVALALLAVDILLKTLLASTWATLLRPCLPT